MATTEGIRIPLTQFLRPNGRQREVWCDDMPADLAPKMDAITAHGCRLTCEELMTGHVSFAVEHPEGDFDIELCVNGPGESSPKNALEKLIRRFDADEFEKWKRALQD
jgi:hypothetical protein